MYMYNTMEKNKKNRYLIDPYTAISFDHVRFCSVTEQFSHTSRQELAKKKKNVGDNFFDQERIFFFPGQQLYFVDFFFLSYFVIFLFFFYLSRGCMHKFKQQLEGGNTEWSMMMMSEHEMAMAVSIPFRQHRNDPLPFFSTREFTIEDFSCPFDFPWIFSRGF